MGKELSKEIDVMFVVGSKTSSNSNRLVEVAKQNNCDAYLIDYVEDIKEKWLEDKNIVGISAGASAPEYRVQEVVEYFLNLGAVHSEMNIVDENMVFTEPMEFVKARKKNI